MLHFIIGIPFCIIASWMTNTAQIILKMTNNEVVKREMEGSPPMNPLFNMYNVAYWGCFLGAIGFDVTSQVYLTQLMWATISALDVMWYKMFSWYWFSDALEFIEIISLGVFISGVLITTFWEPDPRETVMSGLKEYTNSWYEHYITQSIFTPFILGSMAIVYVWLWTERKRMDSDKENYPADWVPHPYSTFNILGIYVNGASTALFFLAMYVCTNTIFIDDTVVLFAFGRWLDLATACMGFAPIWLLSFSTDWWAAANLHNITQVPATLMWSTLFQVGTNFLVWGITFQRWFTQIMWCTGISLEVIGLISWIGVQEYRFTRGADDERQGEDVKGSEVQVAGTKASI